jgi:uncharacterized protein YgbK (DUF1537 family)
MTASAHDPPLVVLDDDPTGTQAVSDVPVLLDHDPELVAAASAGARAVHLLTNSRAYTPERAYAVTRAAAEGALAALGRPRLALRGDSTLRAHLIEEYRAVRDAALPGQTPPLLLVPALPHAGRITVEGVHLLERDGRRIPLHETEYAADPQLGYRDARLVCWAEERSDGFFPAAAGREVSLEELRARGPAAVTKALARLAGHGAPAVCVPDAETEADLSAIATGLRLAEESGAEVLVRSAPAFVGVYAGTLARGHVQPPTEGRPLLVVCGSWVPSTTRQLEALLLRHPRALVEADAGALGSVSADAEVERVAVAASERLEVDGLAVVATSRATPVGRWDAELGERVAVNLARVAQDVLPRPAVVLAKGGITAHVTAHAGLGARQGTVVGPLVDGVALWRLVASDGRHVWYVVFPGNVGRDETLLDVVELIAG